MNEGQLIARVQNGENQAFGRLYDAYIRKIYDFVYFKTLHKETAEDLTSQTFLKALNSIKDYKEEKGAFSSWLYRIAQNTVYDHYRTYKSSSNIEDAWDLPGDENVQADVADKLQLEEVGKYLSLLKPVQRDIIIMRVWQQLSYKEIAEIVGKGEGNCKMIFSRGIKKLRKSMPLAMFVAFLLNI